MIDAKAFSRSYDLVLAHPLPSASSTGNRQETEKERQLVDGKGGKRVGEEPNHKTARKLGPL
jgi:hypothetical protein